VPPAAVGVRSSGPWRHWASWPGQPSLHRTVRLRHRTAAFAGLAIGLRATTGLSARPYCGRSCLERADASPNHKRVAPSRPSGDAVAVRQADFFDIDENQYDQALVLNPPLHTLHEIRQITERLRRHGGIQSVVDFGAGSGRLTIPLLQQGYSVLAVDVSRKSLDNLIKLAERLFLPTPETATDVPLSRTVDAVVGTDILHHVDLDGYLPLLHEALNEGGAMVFSEPGGFNPAWYVYLPLTAPWQIEKGVRHCTYMNLKSKLVAHGFKDVSISGVGLLPRPFFNRWPRLSKLNDALGGLPVVKLFAYRYVIQART
jgi:2-polyprenyl-3-methyl-5-hydroxy-6-metoxy-1,4-benzoquinol methylase